MSPEQRKLRERPEFSTSYLSGDEIISQEFRTREANDEYAAGLELMGVELIKKHYWDPLARKWFPYEKEIFYTTNL